MKRAKIQAMVNIFTLFIENKMYRIVFLVFVLIGNIVYSQKTLSEYKQNHTYKDTDSMRIYSFDGHDIQVFTHARFQEYFIESDTLFRDYIQMREQKIIIDPLLGISGAYTAEYELVEFYEIRHKGKMYFIFEGGDIFPMGSEATVCYIVFEKKENELNFVSTYEYTQNYNHSLGKIKICFFQKS